jgi:hypothetical protein
LLWRGDVTAPRVTNQIARTGTSALEVNIPNNEVSTSSTQLRFSWGTPLACIEAWVRGSGFAEVSFSANDFSGQRRTTRRPESVTALDGSTWRVIANRLSLGSMPLSGSLKIEVTEPPAWVDDVAVWFSTSDCEEK